MPKCSSCGKMFANKKDLELKRADDGRWVMLCAECLVSPSAPAGAEEGGELPEDQDAIDTDAANSEDVPATDEQVSDGEEGDNSKESESLKEKIIQSLASGNMEEVFDNIRNVLTVLDEEPEDEDRVAHVQQRSSERHLTNMIISFSLVRDDTLFQGAVIDISQGGMRFVSTRELIPGQVIKFKVRNSLNEGPEGFLKSAGEVRRVIPREENEWEVGVRFVPHGRATAANRRRHKRHMVDFPVYYRREESGYINRGIIKDISQGGVRILLDERLSAGEKINVMLETDGVIMAKADLRAVAEVRQIYSEDEGEFDLGCSFVDLSIKKIQK